MYFSIYHKLKIQLEICRKEHMETLIKKKRFYLLRSSLNIPVALIQTWISQKRPPNQPQNTQRFDTSTVSVAVGTVAVTVEMLLKNTWIWGHFRSRSYKSHMSSNFSRADNEGLSFLWPLTVNCMIYTFSISILACFIQSFTHPSLHLFSFTLFLYTCGIMAIPPLNNWV